ncbi:hypothetical protein B0H16DRAFT_1697793 [Mycena metata]|uniref:Potassium channel domain-containing protein n=1 Tax=Mycena metata TaxID=1033252 RepID=A0AAD7HSJ9_9AGAR|nr:hypothetical protein B0H16DRAFT_1697793 [Mycena metata]
MNDPGLDSPIQDEYRVVEHNIKAETDEHGTHKGPGIRAAFRKEMREDDDEEEVGFFQPKRWWFTSTAFPLVAGTFGPLANLFSACALSQNWREHNADGTGIPNPRWLNAITGFSLALSLLGNGVLLANFGHLLRYSIAQPITISLWYLSAILLLIPLSLTHTALGLPEGTSYELTQAYYYAIISCVLYFVLPSLLLANALGAYVFHAYPPSFNALTVPQRTLMLQTIIYVLYLAAGAAVFARLEGWSYLDGLYWADYTLLTIGLGSDFPPTTHAARALLMPFAVGGITLIGLVIGSVRGLVLERGKIKVIRRTVELERQKWIKKMEEPDEGWKRHEWEVMRAIKRRAERIRKYSSLASSALAFSLLWFLGALVFFLAEAPQQWTYFSALYFAYTSLLTIGYGDLYPRSNAGKPFFVVWSLMAVPTVTILISNVGDILVGWVRGGLMRGLSGEATSSPKKTSALLKGKGEENDGEKNENKPKRDAGAPPPSDAVKQMGTDVEHLGQAVERAEERRGQGGGLSARIARQVSRLALDATNKPGVEYEWADWESWLTLLGERTDGERKKGKAAKRRKLMRGEGSGSADSGDSAEDSASMRSRAEERGEWTWLGDDGPLFSGMSETQWILGKLCERLEQVLGEEIGGEEE